MPYKPLVSWHNMKTTIQEKKDDLPFPGSRPYPLLVMNTAVDRASSKSEIGVEMDAISWLDGCYALPEEFHSASGDKFDLNECSGIDLHSPWLHDVISSVPLQETSTFTPSLLTTLPPSQIIPSTSAWEEWK